MKFHHNGCKNYIKLCEIEAQFGAGKIWSEKCMQKRLFLHQGTASLCLPANICQIKYQRLQPSTSGCGRITKQLRVSSELFESFVCATLFVPHCLCRVQTRRAVRMRLSERNCQNATTVKNAAAKNAAVRTRPSCCGP